MNLLLIDDEFETRNGLEKYVNWKKLGISKVSSFADPFQALSFLKQNPVSIVLSDIRIPQMDGITLCKKILQISPSVSIIFISGYSDKEYLLNAIQMSAVDYIEKPISISKLENAISKAVDRQHHTQELLIQPKKATQIIQNNQTLLASSLLQKLIHGNFDIPESERSLFSLSELFCYRVYLLKLCPNTPALGSIIEDFRNMLNSEFPSAFLFSQKNEQTWIFILRFSSALECDSLSISRIIHHFFTEENISDLAVCACGQLLRNYRQIPQSYLQAVLALQSVFFQGYGTVLSYHAINSNTTGDSNIPAVSDFSKFCADLNQQKCLDFLTQCYEHFQNHISLLPDMIRDFYFRLLSIIEHQAFSHTNDISSNFSSDYLWQKISSMETLRECHELAVQKTNQLFSNSGEMLSDRKVIGDVIRIIQTQYKDPELYIDQIARMVYMTPNYLSNLFKKETGKTIGTYITETRLKQAAQLLVQTNMRLNEISRAVGYADSNYFARLFKKIYHMTPSEYRNHTAS